MMQRVRIGLTGLALVFLLVMLGSVIRSFSSDEGVALNATGELSAADAEGNGQLVTEPLAELGMAPGSADSENAHDSDTGSAGK